MESLRHWYDLGLCSKEAINIKGKEIIPRDILVELIKRQPVKKGRKVVYCIARIRVIGEKNGKRVEGVVVVLALPTKSEKENSLARATGVPASIMVQMLGHSVRKKGVVGPEVCIDPQEFIQEFLKRPDFEIHESWK